MTWLNDWLMEHVDFYRYALKQADYRTKDWFLLWADPIPTLFLTFIYLLIVYFGPKYMKNRAEVRVPAMILFLYNMALVVLSGYMVTEIFLGVYRSRYNVICQRMIVTNDKNEMRVANALWYYYFSKLIEFLDTIFMIIRKRFNQITFLHVFHHSTMFFLWWIVLTWVPGGQAWMGPFLNSIVHVFMYSYYGLSVFPSLRDKLWWKRYITMLQLTQFVIVLTHTFGGIIYGCDYPLWGQLMLGGYMVIMLLLFRNFYVQEYKTRDKRVKQRKDK
ncbi:unnamed protein product [Adineta ricciae]|uniref:Elongation of very long chain fatty acids protein n=1 Tax=Adineta ricciae TaxID=249248 RepID=A0A814T7Z8_ADIRI|nr:unnamed protein product [Adineta ricciae]CAF1490733.1 unnamed protein product [Adineta ricciae]